MKLKIVSPPQARTFPFYEYKTIDKAKHFGLPATGAKISVYEYENIDKTQNEFCPSQARKIFSQLINARRRRKFFSNINVLEGVFASKINVF